MHGMHISAPCAHLRQNLDGKSDQWPRTSRFAEKSSSVIDSMERPLHASEKYETKLPSQNAFSLYALGRKIVSGLSLQRTHVHVTSDEYRSMLSRSMCASPSRDGLCLGRDSNVKITEDSDSVSSKYISTTSSIKGTHLRGLSYIASFNHDTERSSYNGLSLEQAARVASSSTTSRNPCSPRSIGCASPCDGFASFSDRSEDSRTPSFDLDILNVFEQTLKQLPTPLNGTRGTDDRAVRRSSTAGNLFRQKTDCKRADEKKETSFAKKILEGLRGNPRVKKDISNLKKLSFSVSSEDHEISTTCDLLKRFPLLCPPAGEGKVVLFFTSLRGIRTTYENCNSIRLALFGYHVKIDERDVSMHSDFKRELKDLLGKSISLPRLFVKGRYIGGIEEVMILIEDGILGKLLEDVPRTSVGACEGCADIRFLPCSKCSGSCKLISYENKVVRCPSCNENGLVRCTICC